MGQRAVIYTRVSTQDQSCDRQVADLTAFAARGGVDLVVLSRSEELNARILSYVKDGGYKTKEANEGSPRYYRFREPTKKDCPALIEVFARNGLNLDIQDGQYIIPIHDVTVERLSAILLDDEYFEIIQKNLVTSQSGIPLINAIANICLKARAHRELFDRKAAGDKTVDEKVVQKHLKDIWRLATVLTGEEQITLAGQPLRDITTAIGKLDQLPDSQFKQVMEKTPELRKEPLMTALEGSLCRPPGRRVAIDQAGCRLRQAAQPADDAAGSEGRAAGGLLEALHCRC